MDGMPAWERERTVAVFVLLALVALMGAGAFALVVSGYPLI